MANYLRDAVNKAVKIYDFIKEQDLVHKVVNDEVFIVCPFHKDRNPSCSVSTTKKIFRCFGCQITGDAVFLMAKILKKSTDEVINLYCLKYGISYPTTLEAVSKKNEPDEMLEDLVLRRDIHFLRWLGLTNVLRKARKLYEQSLEFSDEAVFFYNVETWVEWAHHNLRISEEGLELYCRSKGISIPKTSLR